MDLVDFFLYSGRDHPNELDLLEDWVRGGGGVRPEVLTDLRVLIAKAVVTWDRDLLSLVRDRLNPVAAACNRRIEDLSLDERHSVQIPALASIVRCSLSLLNALNPLDYLNTFHPMWGEVLRQIDRGEEIKEDLSESPLAVAGFIRVYRDGVELLPLGEAVIHQWYGKVEVLGKAYTWEIFGEQDNKLAIRDAEGKILICWTGEVWWNPTRSKEKRVIAESFCRGWLVSQNVE